MDELPRTRDACDALVHVARCGSTNDLARQLYGRPEALPARREPRGAGAQDGPLCLVVADEQTRGRGRLGRRWHSGVGDSLTATYVLTLPEALVRDGCMGLVALACGLAVLDALRPLLGTGAAAGLGLKWPNDVYLAGRKLAGILCELAFVESGRAGVVVGVGANLLVAPGRLPTASATSLQLHAQGLPAYPELRDRICADLAQGLRRQARVLCGRDPREEARLLARLNEESALRGHRVRVSRADGKFRGIAGRILADGALEVLRDDGATVRVTAGDVVLREGAGYGPRH